MTDDTAFRIEHDLIGELRIPAGAYYGIHTARALANFSVLGRPCHPELIKAMAAIKQAAALTNRALDLLDAEAAAAICDAAEEISRGLDVIKLGNREVNSRAYCGWFNFKGPDQQKKVGQLSGGERNRVHLAKMLKEGGNLILLDEPTNDLDVETLSALEAALEDFPGCAVVISHDRFFLDRLATHILAFEGDGHVEWFEGNFQEYEDDKRRRLGDAALDTPKAKFARFARG